MLLRKISMTNCRSFLDKAELSLDGPISIIIGPNGGGKTNLLDTVVVMLRRYLFASMYAAHSPQPERADHYEFRHNDVLNNLIIEPHSSAKGDKQEIEVVVEVTKRDLDAMTSLKADAPKLKELATGKYANINLERAANWNLDAIKANDRLTFKLVNRSLVASAGPAQDFLQFLQLYEIDGWLRQEYGLAPLSTPMIYLPVTRASQGLHASVQLSSYNEFEQKRQLDGTSSRGGGGITALAVGRLAQKFINILYEEKGKATERFKADPNISELTALLKDLGYEWDLVCVDKNKNQFDIQLKKQGATFLVGNASSGERELLTYLFSIYALNVRDALIIVDEPELHLHPKWQRTLLSLFATLSEKTGNQFLLATHAPTFVSPQSIQYVSRVFSRDQRSHIVRLKTDELPESKHLLNIVNSQNNERMFFADEVVLVEGLSDRIFFEAFFDQVRRDAKTSTIVEVLSVGGKGLFNAYAKVLGACQIPFSIIADLDYLEQIGSEDIKNLFVTDGKDIKKDVVDNIKSMDGDAFVARIDEAMKKNDWTDAEDVWSYIKSRRRRLRADLTAIDEARKNSFIKSKRTERTYVLSCGSLEDYLPEGYKAKDIDKLIRFLGLADLWGRLPTAGRDELLEISHSILGVGKPEEVQPRPAEA